MRAAFDVSTGLDLISALVGEGYLLTTYQGASSEEEMVKKLASVLASECRCAVEIVLSNKGANMKIAI